MVQPLAEPSAERAVLGLLYSASAGSSIFNFSDIYCSYETCSKQQIKISFSGEVNLPELISSF